MKNGIAMSVPEPKTAHGPKIELKVSTSLYSTHDTRFDSMVFAQGESGALGGVFNYTNAIVGSGIVGMPYACK